MSTGGGNIKYSYPPGVQQNLLTATGLLGQEQSRISNLTAALQGLTPTAYNLLGFNPETSDPYVRSMLNSLIGGGAIDPNQYMQSVAMNQGLQAPAAVANPGPPPAPYVFTGKNFGKNDQAAKAAADAKMAQWQQQNAQYQQYVQQKAVYDQQVAQKTNVPIANYDIYRAQAEQEYQRYQQVQEQNRQLQQFQQQAFARAQDTTGIQGLLAKLQGTLGTEPTGWADAMANLGRYEEQLNAALTPSADWTQQFQTAGQQVEDYQAYLQRVLSGEEPLDPQIAQLASERDVETRNRLYKNLGPGYETSTAGADWLTKLEQARSNTEFQAKQQMLSTGLAGVQGAVGVQGTLQQQQQALIDEALGRYTQGIANIGTLGDIQQRDIASTLGALQSLYANQYQALNVAGLPNQAYQFQDWSGLIPELQSLTATPYSASLMPLIQGYQGLASQFGQQAVARQPSPSLLSQITPLLGTVAGIGLGSFVGPVGAAGGGALASTLFGGGGATGSTGGFGYSSPYMNNSMGYNVGSGGFQWPGGWYS